MATVTARYHQHPVAEADQPFRAAVEGCPAHPPRAWIPRRAIHTRKSTHTPKPAGSRRGRRRARWSPWESRRSASRGSPCPMPTTAGNRARAASSAGPARTSGRGPNAGVPRVPRNRMSLKSRDHICHVVTPTPITDHDAPGSRHFGRGTSHGHCSIRRPPHQRCSSPRPNIRSSSATSDASESCTTVRSYQSLSACRRVQCLVERSLHQRRPHPANDSPAPSRSRTTSATRRTTHASATNGPSPPAGRLSCSASRTSRSTPSHAR